MKLKFINALVAIMLFGCQSLFAQTQSVDFTAVAMNVDGLPSLINSDGPGSDGTTAIGNKILDYGWDIIGCSEDFEYNSQLQAALSATYTAGTYRGSVGLANIISAANTDGLMFFARKATTSFTGESWTAWTDHKGGINDQANDLIKKGFRYYLVTLANDMQVDVYILHMEAGTGTESDGTLNAHSLNAHKQLTQLVNYLKATSNKRPIIVMGDTNCRYTREHVKEYFIDALNADPRFDVHDGWIEKCKGGIYPEPGTGSLMVGDLGYEQGEVVDKLFYINNTESKVKLVLKDFYSDTTFRDASGNPLADHFPVVGHFTAVMEDEGGETVDPDQPGTGGEGGETTDPEQPVDPDDVERTDKDLSENGYWQWTGEEAVANTPVYLYNVGFKGFVNNDGTIVSNPASLWTISNLSSGNVTCGSYRFYMDISSARTNGTSANSRYTSFNTIESTTTGGAYKFVSTSYNRYMNAETTSKWTRAQTASANNDFYIVTEAQKAVYDQYMEDYAKALSLLRTAMPNQIYNELTELLSKDVDMETADEFHATVSTLYMDVTIGAAKYASLCLPFDAWMPASVNALFGVLKNSETITLVKMQGKVLAKNTGAVLFSDVEEATTFRFWRTTSAPVAGQQNVLKGTNVRLEASERNQADNSYYVLANKSAGIGFYILDESKNVAIPANRAYLELPKNSSVKVGGFTFEDSEEADRLEKTEDVVKVSEVYALDGAKRSAMQRGLNIVKMSDGKVRKVMVR